MRINGSVHDWGVQLAQQALEIFRKATVPGAVCVTMHVHADNVAAAHLAYIAHHNSCTRTELSCSLAWLESLLRLN